jgi:TonB family protein
VAKVRGLLGPLCAVWLCAGAGATAVAQQEEEPPKQAGADVPAPKRTKSVPPVYPPEAQAQGLRGIVILELVLDTEGHVASADVVRSVPPFDEAALTAVRQWEYEVTKVDGKPVRVKMTVPISFTMRLPEVTRADGVPELRQGASPGYPAGAEGGASVTARVTLDSDGRVAEAEVKSGGPPWDEALLRAMHTWRFVVAGRGTLSFRVQADFVPPAGGQPARVNLAMSGLQESQSLVSESVPSSEPEASAPPAPEGAAPPAPAAQPAQPEPTGPDREAPRSGQPASPASPPAGAPQIPAEKPGSGAAAGTPQPAHPAAERPHAAPPVEVLSVPPPPPPPSAPGASSLANVSLGSGVPDLVRGRRPVAPPLARMAGASGTVEVRFSVDAAGATAVKGSSGPEVLQAAAEDAVRTWSFRRTTAERIHLIALFNYGADSVSASVSSEP